MKTTTNIYNDKEEFLKDIVIFCEKEVIECINKIEACFDECDDNNDLENQKDKAFTKLESKIKKFRKTNIVVDEDYDDYNSRFMRYYDDMEVIFELFEGFDTFSIPKSYKFLPNKNLLANEEIHHHPNFPCDGKNRYEV